MRIFMTLAASLALTALMLACGGSNSNNANVSNGNQAAVVNTNSNTNKAPTKEDVSKDKGKYEQQAKDAGRKVGKGADDMWLWVKTRYDLAAASDLKDSTINVDVDNGRITLTGTVANKEQVKKADAIAKAVEGNKGVQNKLTVAAGDKNANAKKK